MGKGEEKKTLACEKRTSEEESFDLVEGGSLNFWFQCLKLGVVFLTRNQVGIVIPQTAIAHRGIPDAVSWQVRYSLLPNSFKVFTMMKMQSWKWLHCRWWKGSRRSDLYEYLEVEGGRKNGKFKRKKERKKG